MFAIALTVAAVLLGLVLAWLGPHEVVMVVGATILIIAILVFSTL